VRRREASHDDDDDDRGRTSFHGLGSDFQRQQEERNRAGWRRNLVIAAGVIVIALATFLISRG